MVGTLFETETYFKNFKNQSGLDSLIIHEIGIEGREFGIVLHQNLDILQDVGEAHYQSNFQPEFLNFKSL